MKKHSESYYNLEGAMQYKPKSFTKEEISQLSDKMSNNIPIKVNYGTFQAKMNLIIVDVASILSKMEITITHNWMHLAPPPVDVFEMLDEAKKLLMFLDAKLPEIEEISNLKLEEDSVRYLQLRCNIVISIITKILLRCKDTSCFRETDFVEEVKKHTYLIRRHGLILPSNCSIITPKKKVSFCELAEPIQSEFGSFPTKYKKAKGILIKREQDNINFINVMPSTSNEVSVGTEFSIVENFLQEGEVVHFNLSNTNGKSKTEHDVSTPGLLAKDKIHTSIPKGTEVQKENDGLFMPPQKKRGRKKKIAGSVPSDVGIVKSLEPMSNRIDENVQFIPVSNADVPVLEQRLRKKKTEGHGFSEEATVKISKIKLNSIANENIDIISTGDVPIAKKRRGRKKSQGRLSSDVDIVKTSEILSDNMDKKNINISVSISDVPVIKKRVIQKKIKGDNKFDKQITNLDINSNNTDNISQRRIRNKRKIDDNLKLNNLMGKHDEDSDTIEHEIPKGTLKTDEPITHFIGTSNENFQTYPPSGIESLLSESIQVDKISVCSTNGAIKEKPLFVHMEKPEVVLTDKIEEIVTDCTIEKKSNILPPEEEKLNDITNSEERSLNFKRYRKSKLCIPKNNVSDLSTREEIDLKHKSNENVNYCKKYSDSQFCSTSIVPAITSNDSTNVDLFADNTTNSEIKRDNVVGMEESADADKDYLTETRGENENVTNKTFILNKYKDNELIDNLNLTEIVKQDKILFNNPDYNILEKSVPGNNLYSQNNFLQETVDEKLQNHDNSSSNSGQETHAFLNFANSNDNLVENNTLLDKTDVTVPEDTDTKINNHDQESVGLMVSNLKNPEDVRKDFDLCFPDTIKNFTKYHVESVLLKNNISSKTFSDIHLDGNDSKTNERSLTLQFLKGKPGRDINKIKTFSSNNTKSSIEDKNDLLLIKNSGKNNDFTYNNQKDSSTEIRPSVTSINVLEQRINKKNFNIIENSRSISEGSCKTHQDSLAYLRNKNLEMNSSFSFQKTNFEPESSFIGKQSDNLCKGDQESDTSVDQNVQLENNILKNKNNNSEEGIYFFNSKEEYFNSDSNKNTISDQNGAGLFSQDCNKISHAESMGHKKKMLDKEHHLFSKPSSGKETNIDMYLIKESPLDVQDNNQKNNKTLLETEISQNKFSLIDKPKSVSDLSFTKKPSQFNTPRSFSTNCTADYVGCSKVRDNFRALTDSNSLSILDKQKRFLVGEHNNLTESGFKIKAGIKSETPETFNAGLLLNFSTKKLNINQVPLESINKSKMSLIEATAHNEQLMNTEQFMQNSLDINFSQNGTESILESVSLANIKKLRRFKKTSSFSFALDNSDLDW